MIQAIILLLVVAWAGYETGRNRGISEGRTIGRDEGWNERELDRLNKEHSRNYARRNANGQFKEGHK